MTHCLFGRTAPRFVSAMRCGARTLVTGEEFFIDKFTPEKLAYKVQSCCSSNAMRVRRRSSVVASQHVQRCSPLLSPAICCCARLLATGGLVTSARATPQQWQHLAHTLHDTGVAIECISFHVQRYPPGVWMFFGWCCPCRGYPVHVTCKGTLRGE